MVDTAARSSEPVGLARSQKSHHPSASSALAVAVITGTCILGAGPAHALVITSGCADVNVRCTLRELIDGATMTVEDKLFHDWEPILVQGPVDAAQIYVSGLDDQPNNPGLEYSTNALDIAFPDTVDLDFQFVVSVLSGEPLIKDNSLELVSVGFGGFGSR